MRQIAITDTEIGGYGLPWRYDSTCFNFRLRTDEIIVNGKRRRR